MLNSLSVKAKMLLLSCMMVAGIIILAALLGFGMNSLVKIGQANVLSVDTQRSMQSLRRIEKDFLARMDIKYIEQFNEEYEILISNLNKLDIHLQAENIFIKEIPNIISKLNQYHADFNHVATLQQEIGLTPTDGLYGNLRKSVQAVESVLNELENDSLLKDVLMLRRNEKDFMLRKDLKYFETFKENILVFQQSLQQSLQQSYISDSEQQQINTLMQNYAKDFEALVLANQNIGLTPDLGRIGDMRTVIYEILDLLSATAEQINHEIDSREKNIFITSIISIVVILVILILLSRFISRSVVNPINMLAEIMQRAQQNKDLTQRATIEGKDEIVQMANVFNLMMGTFSQLIQQVFDSSRQLNVAAEELTVITGQTSRGVMSQQSDSDQVATAMNEMTATVQEVARYASQAAEASRTADDETKAGKQVVMDAIEGIKQLAKQVETGAISIKDLQKESENIGSVLTVIQGIAEQTNLLALNAAIEAARAGESGRGFAVVADEVRTLAKRSHDSTEEIKKIIDRLQHEAEKAVRVMDEELEQANQSVEKAEKAGQSLDIIAESVTSIRDMNTHIASAAEEQSAVAEEINRNIVSIAQVAEENAESTNQTTLTSQELARLANGLETQISQFKI